MTCIVLDAMGVIFQAADDVAELLIPFIAENGSETSEEIVRSSYMNTSLGAISADEFWLEVKLSPELEESYLSGHTLMPGVKDLLHVAKQHGIAVWCLSNDVGRWSEKLRVNLGIEELLSGSVISSEVGVRKPDREIYEKLIEHSGHRVENMLFVDDRGRNVNAARALGIEAVQFSSKALFRSITEKIVNGAL